MQIILVAAVVGGFRIQEVAIPTRYTKESSSINVRRSLEYVGGASRFAGGLRDAAPAPPAGLDPAGLTAL